MAAATILENASASQWENNQMNDISNGNNFQIQIFEKNKDPWNKIIISWGGRCNVTTSITNKNILKSKYTRGWDFIRKAIGKFWPRRTYEWFESHGVPLKIQPDLRVFPVSDDGHDIVDTFIHIFAKYRNSIKIHYWEWVTNISTQNPCSKDLEWSIPHAWGLSLEQIDNNKQYLITTSKWAYTADIVVITTGGNAYSHTWSNWDGYAFARALWHTVTPLWPSLSSFLTSESWTHELTWLSFENARIWELTWPILLTHFWLSGPLAFMYSSEIAWEHLNKNTPRTIYLSPCANMDQLSWDRFLREEFILHPKKTIISILSEKLPRRFVEAFVTNYLWTLRDTYVASMSKKDREIISELLWKWLPITLIDRRPWDEFVTAWWVNTNEIDPETMESRIQKNLYFAWEVLNVDWYTGGFSLQICWSSWYVTWSTIVNSLDKV